MDFLADAVRLQVFLEVLGHQVPTVGGGVDQHVVRRGGDRAVEDDLERPEGGVAGIERQVVAEDDEALGPSFEEVDDVRQVDEVVLLDLDHAQAARGVFVEQRLDQRRFAGAARAGEQHVVGRPTGDELPRVDVDARLLRLDVAQVGEADRRDARQGLQVAGGAALAPAEGDGGVPVGHRGGGRQQRFEAFQQAFGALQERGQWGQGVAHRGYTCAFGKL